MFYEQQRLKELELQKENIKFERERFNTDIKRQCIDIASRFEVTTSEELLKEAEKIYAFIGSVGGN